MKLLSVFFFASVVFGSPTLSLECLDNSDCDDGLRCSISLSPAYSSQCISATHPAQLNELCQGSMDVGCAPGLFCSHSTKLTDQFDAGVCLKSRKLPSYPHGFGELGGVCGGFAGVSCPDSLQCKFFDHGTDAQGVCYDAKASLQELGLFGGLCGGADRTPCAQGLECKAPRPHSRDPLGVCMGKNAL